MLSAGHARALLAVEDSEEQDRLAHRIVAEGPVGAVRWKRS
ncbi:hypothetical protein LT493_15920 [Streptomyces tricolor]|nr:hypothetical protein [Streptomyces tricolor]